MSSIAVFAVLGGGAYAATALPKNSVGTKQLKKNAVVSKKVKNGSLLKSDFKAGQLPAGARGPAGAKGDPGTNGTNGIDGTDGQDGATGPAGPATGPAGGGLAGTYPNPTIAAGAVGPPQWGAIPQAKATFSGGDQPVNNQSATVINWGAEAFDTSDMHDNTTNPDRLIAPTAGVYLVTAAISWEANSAGSRQLQIRRTTPVAGVPTTSTVHSQIISSNGGADFFTIQTTATLLKLAAGDFLQVRGVQDSGTQRQVNGGDFAMTWVGAG